MIISCTQCDKKFEIESNLIPNEGRLLQCSSCNHKWFYKKKTEKVATDNLKKQIFENKKILPHSKINLSSLQKSKLVNKKYKKLKLLGLGDIKEKFDVEVNFISKSAKDKIEKSGGKVTLVK